VSYTTNTLDQYTAIGSVTPTYNANGNLTFDGTFAYGYVKWTPEIGPNVKV